MERKIKKIVQKIEKFQKISPLSNTRLWGIFRQDIIDDNGEV